MYLEKSVACCRFVFHLSLRHLHIERKRMGKRHHYAVHGLRFFQWCHWLQNRPISQKNLVSISLSPSLGVKAALKMNQTLSCVIIKKCYDLSSMAKICIYNNILREFALWFNANNCVINTKSYLIKHYICDDSRFMSTIKIVSALNNVLPVNCV